MGEREKFLEWHRAAEQDETPQITEPWLPRDVNPLIAEAWQARADLAAERERELTKAAKRLIWSARAGYQVTPSQINELDKAIAKLESEDKC